MQATPTDTKRSEILTEVSAIIIQVMGDELELDAPIAMETLFNRDLELESIEFVALAEQIQERYGAELNFAAWLSGKELDEIIELRVGDLVELIAGHQA